MNTSKEVAEGWESVAILRGISISPSRLQQYTPNSAKPEGGDPPPRHIACDNNPVLPNLNVAVLAPPGFVEESIFGNTKALRVSPKGWCDVGVMRIVMNSRK